MRSININILQAVSTLYAAGEITKAELQEAINTPRGLNMPCGAAKDEHGHFYSFFVATEKEQPTKARRNDKGDRIKFNLRANDVKKTQVAQTPGQVLPAGTQGAPQLDAASLAAVEAILQRALGLKATPPAEQAQAPEADFSDLNEVL